MLVVHRAHLVVTANLAKWRQNESNCSLKPADFKSDLEIDVILGFDTKIYVLKNVVKVFL